MYDHGHSIFCSFEFRLKVSNDTCGKFVSREVHNYSRMVLLHHEDILKIINIWIALDLLTEASFYINSFLNTL